MRNKFVVRDLPNRNPDKLKGLIEEKFKEEQQQPRDDLRQLAESIKQMTREIKEMKMSRLGSEEKNKSKNEGFGINVIENMEKRLQDVDLAIPTLRRNMSEEEREEEILVWLTKVCKAVFSVGFNFYESGVLDINKAKAYCSQNVIRNLIYFSRKNDLTQKQVEAINKFLEEDLLPYLCQKYPQSEESQTSAKFTSDLIVRDQMEGFQHDLVKKSKSDFDFQQNGNYNSDIMRFLNYIINLPNKIVQQQVKDGSKNSTNEEKKGKPLNQLFYAEVESLFKMVEVENNTINMKKYNPKQPVEFQWTVDQSTQKEKEEYRQKVKAYTSFQIGQKLSKNFKPFSESEIQSGNLVLKNSKIRRVVTKWCEELEQYFDPANIFDKSRLFRMKDGSERPSFNFMQSFFQFEGQVIEGQVQKQIHQNNYKWQSEFFKKETHPKLKLLSESEAAVGEFASLIYRNNQSYLINYLNALIHGLNKGKENFSKLSAGSNSTTPDFISFKIGDLLRCKCSSRESQIIALYKEIERRHRLPNSTMKIIRVKNRLNKGNKDILINLLYRDEIIVEIQLAIKSEKTKFIECSYNFNHYLYELKRAKFGLMEMCNIWVSKDLKSKYYLEKTEKLNKRIKKQKPKDKNRQRDDEEQKQKQNNGPKVQTCCQKSEAIIKLPFKCSFCSFFYSNSSEVLKNTQCRRCHKYTCFMFQLENSEQKRINLLKQITQLKDQDLKNIELVSEIPKEGGLMVNLKSKKKIGVYFIVVKEDTNFYLFQYQESKKKLNFIDKLKSLESAESLLRQNLVFTSRSITYQLQEISSLSTQAVKNYFIQKYLEDACKNQNRVICLVDKNFDLNNLNKLKAQSWPYATTLQLSTNLNLNVETLVKKFPNVQKVVLNSFAREVEREKLQNFPSSIWPNLKILNLQANSLQTIFKNKIKDSKLEQLYLDRNKLQSLPTLLSDHKQLKILSVRRNQIKTLSDGIISELKNLEEVKFDYNKIQNLPENIGNLKNLRKLYLQSNSLTNLPQSIGNCLKLEEINLAQNKLVTLPSNFGNLAALKQLNLQKNKLTQIPKQFSNLKSLQNLQLAKNQLSKLSSNFAKLQSLISLSINTNKFEKFPQQLTHLSNLQSLDFDFNKLQQIHGNIGNLTKLKLFTLCRNPIKQIPESMGKLKSLKKLTMRQCQIQRLPESFLELQVIQNLDLSVNKIGELPDNFGKLQSLVYLDLSENSLKYLPDSIGKLAFLDTLNVSQNQIKSLPPSTKNLRSLTQLKMHSSKVDSKMPWLFTKPLNLLTINMIQEPQIPMFLASPQILRHYSIDIYYCKEEDKIVDQMRVALMNKERKPNLRFLLLEKKRLAA